jgi:hypothetical protein
MSVLLLFLTGLGFPALFSHVPSLIISHQVGFSSSSVIIMLVNRMIQSKLLIDIGHVTSAPALESINLGSINIVVSEYV